MGRDRRREVSNAVREIFRAQKVFRNDARPPFDALLTEIDRPNDQVTSSDKPLVYRGTSLIRKSPPPPRTTIGP